MTGAAILATDVIDNLPSPEDWNNCGSINAFLELPEKITQELGASSYITLSRAVLANQTMIKHCNAFISGTNPF